MHETFFFCQNTELLAATSNLHVEQNLVHLGRLLRFRSLQVAGVTLKRIDTVFSKIF